MSPTVSRRTFMAGLAGVAAACGSSSPQVKTTYPLTVYYTGLIFFKHDKDNSEMRVGFLDYSHKTIIVGRKGDVDTAGRDPSADELLDWNPIGLSNDPRDLTCWEGNKFTFTITSDDSLSVKSPFGVFPLESLAKMPSDVKADTRGVQSLVTLKNGEFAGHKRAHALCEHENAKWQMVKDDLDNAPQLSDVMMVDTVRQTAQIEAGGFTIDDGGGVTTVKFKPGEVRLWILQHDYSGSVKDPKEILHCQHYYDMVAGYGNGIRYYPRRDDELPKPCRDALPIYCTPGEP
jgi:hypothetical protein